MTPRRKDSNQKTAKQVSKVTKTTAPKGEDLLGSVELKQAFEAAKKASTR
jgi:hypothetical protein